MKNNYKFVIDEDDYDVLKMLENLGHERVSDVAEADYVMFTGGEDVYPRLYHEEPLPTTFYNLDRDEYCMNLYGLAKGMDLPMFGICRGGQFLHVMAGYKMHQHVPGHAINGTHPVYVIYGEYFAMDVDCTSTHHQTMSLVPWKDKPDSLRVIGTCAYSDHLEIVYHPKDKSLSFQPHPEYVGYDHECQVLWRSLFNDLMDKEDR